ncbi:glycosyltransferase [Patescibacteria group bacterium]|nr:glycosyltransferase [Patescibacteria group bacterium]
MFSIIIVNYNTLELTKNCIISVLKHCSERMFEIILVDNNSCDGSVEYFKDKFINKVKIISNKTNVGFGCANNQASKIATGKYLFFLNSDTIVSDNILEKIDELFIFNEGVGIVLPKLILEDGSEQAHAYGDFPNIFSLISNKFKVGKRECRNGYFETDWVTGAALVIRKSIFDMVGGFDEKFFMYFEDIDLCKKVNVAGFVSVVLPSVHLIHLGGGSSKIFSLKKELYYVSQDYYFRKHLGVVQLYIMKLLRCPIRLFIKIHNKVVSSSHAGVKLTAMSMLSLFLLLTFLSLPFSSSLLVSLVNWFYYLFFGIVYFIFMHLRLRRRYVKILLFALLLISVTLSLVGLDIYLGGSYNRLTSVFYWPNPFASFLLLTTPIGLYFLFVSTDFFRKILFALLSGINITALILTGSRGAFLCGGIVCLFLFVIKKVNLKNIYFSLVLVTLSIGIFFSVIDFMKGSKASFIEREESSIGVGDVSANIRLDYWNGAVDIIANYPLFGSGLGTFSLAYPEYQVNPLSSGKYAHNWYLELLSEVGVVNFVFFALFLLYMLYYGFLLSRKDDLCLVIYLCVLAFLMHNFIDIGSHYQVNNFIFWIYLGLLSNAVFVEVDTEDTNINIINIGKFYLLVGLCLFLVVGVVITMSYYNFNIGVAHKHQGDYVQSEIYLERAVKVNILSVKYLRELAIIKYTLGLQMDDQNMRSMKLAESRSIANYLIQHDEGDSLNYELSGKLFETDGNTLKAENEFKRAISLDKYRPRYYINLINLLIGQERILEANEYIEKVLNYYPDEVVNRKELLIMDDQIVTSGIKNEINYLLWLKQILLNRK